MKKISKFFLGKNKIVIGTLFLWFLVLFIISIVAPVIPFNGDEAANYLEFSRFGPIYPIFHYELPNNHVFFTVLQSLLVPKVMLSFLPAFPRFLNIIVTVCLFSFLFIFINHLSKKIIFGLILLIACFFISPLVTPYFIVARGYLLGLTLLLIGIYFMVKNKFLVSSVLFILSGWTVPTYAYALPFIYISAMCLYSGARKKVLLSAISTLLGLFICYLFVIGQMLAQVNIWGYNSLLDFITQTLLSITNFSYIKYGYIFNVVYLLLFVISVVVFFKEKENKKIKELIIFLISAVFGYLIIICGLSIFLHANEPFLRNGLFIPLFTVIILYIIALLTKNNNLKVLIFIIIILNILAGAYLLVMNFKQVNPRYPVFAGEQYYTDNKLLQLIKDKGATHVSEKYKNDYIFRYYLSIYSPGLLLSLSSNKVSESKSSSSSANVSKLDLERIADILNSSTAHCKKESNSIILPTNKLYVFKKLFQNISLKFISFFDYSKQNTSRYLLNLSDNTYSDADILWKDKNYDLAINTVIRAENYMTMLAGNITIMSQRKVKNQKLYSDIQESICLHKNILQNMINSRYGTSNAMITNIKYFFITNYQAVQVIK
jgi:hypothetical protein